MGGTLERVRKVELTSPDHILAPYLCNPGAPWDIRGTWIFFSPDRERIQFR